MFYNSLTEMQKSYKDRVKDILDKGNTLPANKREILQIFDYLAEQHANDVMLRLLTFSIRLLRLMSAVENIKRLCLRLLKNLHA